MTRARTVVVDDGLQALLKGGAVQATLLSACEEKAAELESDADAHLHAPHAGALFAARVKVLDHCAIGKVVAKDGTGRGGLNIGAAIGAKHGIIHW